jgi:hypothetical protein
LHRLRSSAAKEQLTGHRLDLELMTKPQDALGRRYRIASHNDGYQCVALFDAFLREVSVIFDGIAPDQKSKQHTKECAD